jgi:large subunit ribosomal protein L23
MAIFNKKEKQVKKEKKVKKTKEAPIQSKAGILSARSHAHVLLSPRITEKATDLSVHDAYVFNVDPRAGKKEIAAAVEEAYTVTPIAIRTMRTPGKATFVRGRRGKTISGKKAIVFLKKGDKIEFV